MEPFQEVRQIHKFKRKLGMQYANLNQNGKIWIFVQEHVQNGVISDTEQQISLQLHFLETGQTVVTTALIGGDFNVILYEEEKIGGLPIYPQENEDFAFCVNSYDILDIHFTGSPYTWWNGRIDQDWIFKRLDRFFVNANLLSTFGGAEVVHLSRDGSDHAPLLLSYGGQERVVRNNWVSAESDVFINLKQKLKKTKTTLSQWSNRMILQRAQAEVKSYVHYEEEYWRQKVGIQWFVEGEKNTRFFHCLGQALVAAEAELFFQDQFLDRRAEVELTLLDYIPTVINDVENEMINSLLTFEEVKAVVFELNGDSASGPRAGHKY
ncbi:hypothetical protein KY290_013484 [Solanum tuberosum]|uniref:Endonuclease/exonuclease/phosphatase domain-containing protein n=1 Tax=Solanum tuberosum TaxID=4113 RepID=A0ABQ7VLX1_SOLTU|nr:hypothetical protein KY285_012939 [Solanum tuberosum]KAH0769503.1 hypothetical protein KY290_013484 [Solanum tuberosum]